MSWRMTLDDLLTGSGGRLIQTGPTEFTGVATDGRVDNKGKIFFALKGENFDAHDFLAQAIQSGASALVIHREPEQMKSLWSGLTVVQVDDTLLALQRLGHHWRQKMSAKIVGITGTNGKTTTKEFASAIVATQYPTYAAKGSFNNHFGVPLTLLSMEPHHKVAILEMGMNHPGELKRLVEIADPDVVMVTMVGRGHLEGLGSVEGVAKEKEEIYRWSRPEALRIFNLDNAYTRAMLERAPRESPILTFSSAEASATVSLKEVLCTLEHIEVSGQIRGEPGRVRVPVFGRHNLHNLMGAACVALACGMEPDQIWKALPSCRSAWGRNQILKMAGGSRLIFDAYNANPESMGALIDNISRVSVGGKKFLILGEMLEMGEESRGVHEELGEKAGQSDVDYIWFMGPHKTDFARGIGSTAFSKTLVLSDGYEEKLAHELSRMLEPSDIVIVKGSRGMKLERVVSALDPQGLKKD